LLSSDPKNLESKETVALKWGSGGKDRATPAYRKKRARGGGFGGKTMMQGPVVLTNGAGPGGIEEKESRSRGAGTGVR